MEFEVHYVAPKGTPQWSGAGMGSLDDEQHLLVDVEQNIANLEESLARGRCSSDVSESEKPKKGKFLRRSGSYSTPEMSPGPQRKR